MEPSNYRRMAEIQSSHWWYEGRRDILSAVIKKLRLPANATVLEVGCGPGANLQMLQQYGIVSAMEPDDFARGIAHDITGLDIDRGFLPDDLPYNHPFDLVCAFDVIEHVEQDLASLNKLNSLTKDNGWSIFTVPAYQFLWSLHDVRNHHFRRYTRPGLRALLEQAGYDVVFISYYNTLLFPLVLMIRAAKKLLHIADSPDDQMPRSGAINKALRAIFSFERHLLAQTPLPFGVSILAVCRKRAA